MSDKLNPVQTPKSPLLYSIIDSPTHPPTTAFYQQLGLRVEVFNSNRKAISKIKKQPPDFLVAEFRYGYSNNYAGVNISNLDVMLMSMQRYAPETKVIVLVSKKERQFVDKLEAIFPLRSVLVHPISPEQLADALSRDREMECRYDA